MQFVNLLIIKLGDYWNKSPRSKFIANSYLNFYILLPIKFRENIVFELNFQNSDFMDRHLFKNPEFQNHHINGWSLCETVKSTTKN